MNSSYRHYCQFDFSYEETHVAQVIELSLAQEIGEINNDRSKTRLFREGETVSIEIVAHDLVAFRAAMNTWLVLTTVAENITQKL